jgi:tripartite-type tricarboxylate transporter receptor subunit TctC
MIRHCIRKLGIPFIAAAAAAIAAVPVQAGSWPARPVSIVVAGAPGGGTDAIARIVATDFGSALKQNFLVENRSGAGGIIGTKYVAAAAPDGYTLLMGHVATNAIVPALIRPRPYDPVKDFVPVGIVGTAPDVLVVSSKSGIHSLAELLAKAKESHKPLTYGSPGVGLPQHIAGFALSKAAGVPMQHVPYRGSAPALADLLGGQISMMFVTPGAAVPFLKSGQLRALAVTSHQRSRFFPDVPTIAELGYPSVEETGWFGLFAPAGTPAAVVQTLRTHLAQTVAKPQIRAKFEGMYLETALDPATRDFPAFVQSEATRWAQVIQQLGVTAD